MIGLNWRSALSLLNLTLLLGSTVAASWLIFGGGAAFRGPDRVLRESWPLIYSSQAILAAGLTWLVMRREAVSRMTDVLVLVSGAWIGELIALTVGGNLLANEIDPANAWVFWWMGTGGPLQPIAALVGGLIRLRWKA